MNIKEQVNKLFSEFKIGLTAETVKLASMDLDNGTTVHTDGDDFVEGADVYIINDEGEKIPLPKGDYSLTDGGSLSVADGGKIASVVRGADGKENKEAKKIDGNPKKATPKADAPAKGTPAKPEPPKPTPPPKKSKKSTDMAEEIKDEENVEETNLEPQLTEEEIVAIINRILDERFPAEEEVVEEEANEDEEKEEMSEEDSKAKLSSDKLKEEIETLKAELSEAKKEAASNGVKRVDTPKATIEAVDLSKLTTEERVKALAKQYNS